jgi:glycosyltransferase involved in cell wall biosynthesis
MVVHWDHRQSAGHLEDATGDPERAGEPGDKMTWALITGEYPPQLGGVGDYTRLVAAGLAGDGGDVHVWAPATRNTPPCADAGVVVHRLPGHFGPAALLRLDSEVNRLPPPRRILVQYVPHAFGWKAMNLPFCLWLQSRRRDAIWSMFHEVAFPLERSQPLKHNALGVVTEGMARIVAKASERIFFSTTAWLSSLDRYARSTRKTWLPVPSNLAENVASSAVAAVRTRLANGSGSIMIGHFGTYAPNSVELLIEVFARLLGADAGRFGLFAGRGSTSFRVQFAARNPALEQRVYAVETPCAITLSAHLAACDVMVQPYPDGVTTRRASLMAGLALGKAVVTTQGKLTESLWEESAAVSLAPVAPAGAIASCLEELLANGTNRTNLGARAAALYADRFALRHTVRTLLSQ